jgi:predicted acylesterase/phospholipase RssA
MSDAAAGARPVQAVVLSGGGASGAYEVGVVKALATRSESPLDPQVFAGTSIGSFNAAFLASQWDSRGSAAAHGLETVWRQRLANRPGPFGANGLYRVRANPLEFLDPESYLPNPLRPFLRLAGDGWFFFLDALRRVSSLPMVEGAVAQRVANLLDLSAALALEPWVETIGALDFAAMRSSRRLLRIAVTNFESGKLRVFENRDMTDELGPVTIRASSAIPGLLPAVSIGAQKHVDGGVVMNTPLTLGINAGADELHVIYLDPRIDAIPTASLDSTLDSTYRNQVIGWSKLVNMDIAAARRINSAVQALARLRADPRARGVDFAWLARQLHIDKLAPITVHRYHPHDDLAGGALGLLNFHPDHVGRLIDRGFEDTMRHDCDESQCVLLAEDGEAESVPARRASGGPGGRGGPGGPGSPRG